MKRQLSIKRVLVDGTILSVLLSIVIYGSLYVDPLMWISDYPPDIQAAVGAVDVPLSQTIIVGIFLALSSVWCSAQTPSCGNGTMASCRSWQRLSTAR